MAGPGRGLSVRADTGRVDFEPRPLWITGRYQKLVRTLPQTPHHCRRCRGKGCPDCGDTGRAVPGSVAELVVPSLVEAAGARDGTFSGCGREDIDVRMLGEGRPFVVRLEHPKRRSLDLAACSEAANASAGDAASFTFLGTCGREEAQRLTTTHPPKTYGARVEVEGGAVAAQAAAVAAAFDGVVIGQRTPLRVARRRADKVRRRRIHSVSAEATDDGLIEIQVRCEGGTYVKEWISGDDGRTEPSVTSVLGKAATCVELDVLAVEFDPR
ncbi:MAG: tRNA pseudouridine(54/55) synthase Pus10 [Planctomycetota bacterium]